MKLPENSVLLLEGGALRGCYTSGVLDVLMENDCYFPTVAAVSAGGLNAVNYLARQPGRSARTTLAYRHDPRYVGAVALLKSHGIFGFDFMFNRLMEKEPFDRKTYEESPQKLFVAATDVGSGQATMFEKGKCADFNAALAASASMPLCSLPVRIGGRRYLDGGCACAIPLEWALERGYGPIVVVSTRPRGYRKPMPSRRLIDLQDGQGRTIGRIGYKQPPMGAPAGHRGDFCGTAGKKEFEPGNGAVGHVGNMLVGV